MAERKVLVTPRSRRFAIGDRIKCLLRPDGRLSSGCPDHRFELWLVAELLF